MSEKSGDQLLLEAAEAQDRKISPARIEQLKESYQFFVSCGMSDDAINSAMALTDYEWRRIHA